MRIHTLLLKIRTEKDTPDKENMVEFSVNVPHKIGRVSGITLQFLEAVQ